MLQEKSVDILENELIEKYSNVLDILLFDRTTQKNITWATENYAHLGHGHNYNEEILLELISGEKGNIIMPRVQKDKVLQLSRSKEMAEVFTPSWICNAQNNLVDNSWFNKENIFNVETLLPNGKKTWESTKGKIIFPKGKIWQDYVRDTRLEITCGEAPYLASRYDTTTGEFIEIEDRIGLLDRKLRIVNENVNSLGEWLEAVETAYKSTYGFEWQGDSLLLAREALLITFIENFKYKFESEPTLQSIQNIAEIISWNIWQMDGLKGVIPNSCKAESLEIVDIFETKIEIKKCKGCEKQNITKHNGIYCDIMDWGIEKPIKFISLLEK